MLTFEEILKWNKLLLYLLVKKKEKKNKSEALIDKIIHKNHTTQNYRSLNLYNISELKLLLSRD